MSQLNDQQKQLLAGLLRVRAHILQMIADSEQGLRSAPDSQIAANTRAEIKRLRDQNLRVIEGQIRRLDPLAIDRQDGMEAAAARRSALAGQMLAEAQRQSDALYDGWNRERREHWYGPLVDYRRRDRAIIGDINARVRLIQDASDIGITDDQQFYARTQRGEALLDRYNNSAQRKREIATWGAKRRLTEMLELAVPKAPGAAGKRLKELLEPANLALFFGALGLAVGVQFIPVVGEVLDVLVAIVLGVLGGAQIAADILNTLSGAIQDTLDVESDEDLEEASDRLADGAGRLVRDAALIGIGIGAAKIAKSVTEILRAKNAERAAKAASAAARAESIEPTTSQLTTAIPLGEVGTYTTRIKWGAQEVDVRPAGPGYWGKRTPQNDPAVDAYERRINPNNESYYLPHPDGGFVQFENVVGTTLQDGKLIQVARSWYKPSSMGKMRAVAERDAIARAKRQMAAADTQHMHVEWLVSDKNAAAELTVLFTGKGLHIKVTYYPE